jgi:hypothetical protein
MHFLFSFRTFSHFYPNIARYICQKTNRICWKQTQKLISADFISPLEGKYYFQMHEQVRFKKRVFDSFLTADKKECPAGRRNSC